MPHCHTWFLEKHVNEQGSVLLHCHLHGFLRNMIFFFFFEKFIVENKLILYYACLSF